MMKGPSQGADSLCWPAVRWISRSTRSPSWKDLGLTPTGLTTTPKGMSPRATKAARRGVTPGRARLAANWEVFHISHTGISHIPRYFVFPLGISYLRGGFHVSVKVFHVL